MIHYSSAEPAQKCHNLTPDPLLVRESFRATNQLTKIRNHLLKPAPLLLKEKIKTELGIEKEGRAGKYLDVPEHFGRKKRDLFTSIVEKIKQRTASWSTRYLSPAGKMTLLKSVLEAISNHTMQCFKLPQSLCKRIQSALTRFWWDPKAGVQGCLLYLGRQ
ncbi:uncharacterized protein LOC130498010 [Raphanus sativus]|uniref:Uncharacterized protein LOC130498010 n=1 Tax=Raphanus sativus TaxID=3726 RepID=A0A9W3C716_RAPSA|nr:uncharacterized protein LOC130498010 [Raphanus sativus]